MQHGEIVVLGADHNGVALKKEVKKLLVSLEYSCIDLGPHNSEEKVDYVDYAKLLGNIVNNGEAKRGILICGTGVGMSIAVNRFPNIRAALVHSPEVAAKSREHNDANVLCLGAWVNPVPDNLDIVKTWLKEKFGEGRHVPRIEKLTIHNPDKIVFTNGIFDLLHLGHIQLLKFAKSLGGKLIVGINSDRATKILKGKDRPINDEEYRKAIIESLDFVDQVVIFDDTKTLDIIKRLKPNVIVKGGEWTANEVRRRDKIPANIEVVIYPYLLDSTTNIIKRVQGKK